MSRFHTVLYSVINSCLLVLSRHSCHSSNSTTTMGKTVKPAERLCKLVVPMNYRVIITPDLESGTYSGLVLIKTDIKEQKSYIHLHSKLINITNVQVFKNYAHINVLKYTEDPELEYLTIHFESVIEPGVYDVGVEYTGNMTNRIVGLYSSRFKNGIMAASKFQPTYARQTFPCFDEPGFKATFEITLNKKPSYVALSNMNEISSILDETTNLDRVTFATSVPMSTYLVCFVVCDFKNLETIIDTKGIGKDFQLRTFAQKDQMQKINFAQDIAKRATEYYVQYYQVPFPLPKLDMIAIPDYVSGATEHWGLITYRETSFLIDEQTASSTNKINVAGTITHELAHMWFGNLVTMKWWDEVWLNEGFATYMQVKALNAIEPTWTMLDQFLLQSLHPALSFDAKLSSHPIVQTVSTPDQITAIFDLVSYHKGASVLRMLEGVIGEENFRIGIKDYLQKYQFDNTVTADLLNCLKPYFEVKHEMWNIGYIVDTWIQQKGYPLLTVAPGKEPGSFVITQSRFLIDPSAKSDDDSKFKYRWTVPITYKTNDGTHDDILWFPDTKDEVTINLKASDDTWLKINNNQVGYYRVNYHSDMWLLLINRLNAKSNQLTISDRAHLLNDIFALAEAQIQDYSLALDLALYLRSEDQYVPWATAASIFAGLSQKLLGTPAHEHLLAYIQFLVKPIYEKQSWEKKENETVIDGLIRTTVLRIATKYGIPDAQSNVRRKFLKWLNSHGSEDFVNVEPDLRDIVYYYGMKSSTMEEWDRVWQIYLKEEDVQEQAKLRRALASPDSVDILTKYMTQAWSEQNVRSQDYLKVLDYIAESPAGANLVWNDVRERWQQLVDRFTLNSRYLGSLIPAITENFNTEIRLKEMESFFEKYPDAGAGESARQQALEGVRINVQWLSHNEKHLLEWLKPYSSKSSTE